MLYPKSKEKTLDKKLFQNPTSEYRGTPFWAWNCELDKDMLLRQIEYLKEMGFGGFHIHSRSGMATEYLSEEFMKLVGACVDKAKDEDMFAYLYDEDRWPSGSAGGYVTRDIRYRQRLLEFTPNKKENTVSAEEAYKTGRPALIASFDVTLDDKGCLSGYKKAESGENMWYAYLFTEPPRGWHNGQAYADLMNPDAVDKFIEVTHEAYKKSFGDEFGKTIPSIFTDEPQVGHFTRKWIFEHPDDKTTLYIPWSPDFKKLFKEKNGFDLTDCLPEIFWEKPNGELSKTRYLYYDFVAERFAEVYAGHIGKWCEKNGIKMTGHLTGEDHLKGQVQFGGESMRSYKYFSVPGIDILGRLMHLSTAKQAQSAAHQYGREGVMSELYGVTNWDLDFRGHKLFGDWQAALGITMRVPHLSWVSMKGSAKRDYPASINYQSPWFKKYSYIEDHFARVNTALTRGKPVVKVAVVHPVESFWVSNGPQESAAEMKAELERSFKNTVEWLLYGKIDFDFVAESLLPSQYKKGGNTLNVGDMSYSAVVVPPMRTIRSTTLDVLEEFANNGGKIVFMGNVPEYADAERCGRAVSLSEKCVKISDSRYELLNALSDERDVDILHADGRRFEELIYSLRQDGDCRWLFVARAALQDELGYCNDSRIKLCGEYTPILYDTLSGEIKDIPFEIKNGVTEIEYTFYESDSLLLQLLPKTTERKFIEKSERRVIKKLEYLGEAEYSREEPNVYLLDIAKYSLDGGAECEEEEILRIDTKIREKLGFVPADGHDVQPWMIKKEQPQHFVKLCFEIPSTVDVDDVYLAYEEAEEIVFNEKKIDIKPCGYYVDESIHKLCLGNIVKGINSLVVTVPITDRLSLENMFLLGEFDVTVKGMKKMIEKKNDKIAFSSITHQGLPFYSGNITYKYGITIDDACDLEVQTSLYKGTLVSVSLDGGEEEITAFAPNIAEFKNVSAGKHEISFKLYGNRHNTFCALHNCKKGIGWGGPKMWYITERGWSYEYVDDPLGILKSPVITMLEES